MLLTGLKQQFCHILSIRSSRKISISQHNSIVLLSLVSHNTLLRGRITVIIVLIKCSLIPLKFPRNMKRNIHIWSRVFTYRSLVLPHFFGSQSFFYQENYWMDRQKNRCCNSQKTNQLSKNIIKKTVLLKIYLQGVTGSCIYKIIFY